MFQIFCALCAALFAVVILGSCATTIPVSQPPTEEMQTFGPEVRVWVDRHPCLSPRDVLASCAFWCRRGISCTLVDKPNHANVKVVAEWLPCTKDSEGDYHLADAKVDLDTHVGLINIRVECFRNSSTLAREDPFDQPRFRSVLAHEFGHTFGIWSHVPISCKKATVFHSSGVPVCGPALMGSDSQVPTAIDDLAFDMRSTSRTVLHPGTFSPEHEAASVCQSTVDVR